MKAAICDDENYWREVLTECLNEYGRKRHIDIVKEYFSCGESLVKCSRDFDLIFMDFQMSDINGIETARQIRQSNKECDIIFVSAFPNVALDTFELNTFRFLAKPIEKEKLFKSLDDYIQKEKSRLIVFKTHDGTVKIKESDIIYCESIQKHTIIYTANEIYEILINIREIEKRLSKEKFIRCHKSYITSFYHIKTYDNLSIINIS
ncbi:MAG: LytTR family DNA-binding domain-containing protein [Oscillospiraceae bacterium]|nr:LytTR family DNA-binding domain-containing protein [Oscillospiraceae bacterium]